MIGDGEGHLTTHFSRVQKPILVCSTFPAIHLLQWFCQMIDLNHQGVIINISCLRNPLANQLRIGAKGLHGAPAVLECPQAPTPDKKRS